VADAERQVECGRVDERDDDIVEMEEEEEEDVMK